MTKRTNPLDRYARFLKPGEVTWIGLRPERKAPLQPVETAMALAGLGLEGDHRVTKTPGSGRQVTLISKEFIQQIQCHTGIEAIDPGILRRNIVVSGINLNALRHQRFYVGEALLEASQLCHPCARMERALGPGGVAAMMGYGGLCARIIESGRIRIGDAVTVLDPYSRADADQLDLYSENKTSKETSA